ncbi:Aldehyde dehydrogenase [Mycena indigotica]|uniref:Aldehyde dehydrogenase n=1 Tax=Mycena indigotica TaxID=2126181 RepID=A0A8H6RXT5_9AGAR|nr:Aldehyde dehydrogenase [Mycena indigotica]KAF7289294.1 Aldehyde dehydrogenase [Mycena indigotica]
MKRGFLNSKPAKDRPLGSPVASKTDPVLHPLKGTVPSQLPYATLDRPVDVPKGYETKLNFVTGASGSDTQPATAAYVWIALPQVGDEPDTECLFVPETKQIFLNTSGFPKPLPPAPTRPAFCVAPSPGKGMGLFSTRNIKQGEIILHERPLLIAPVAVFSNTPAHFSEAQIVQHSLNEFERFAEVSVNRMTPQRRAAFMSLHNCHTMDGSGPIVGRIRTNGIGLSGLQPGLKAKTDMEVKMGTYSVICDNISRLNHSCSPNTAPSFDRAMLAYRLYAVRDIAKGEELTFQYVNVLSSKSERSKALKPYDVRRSAISGFVPTLSAWAPNCQLPDDWLINKSTELLELIEKEHLEHLEVYCIANHAIMEAYICLGDSQNASKWAARVELLDPESPAYAKHGLWRMRVDENPTGEIGAMLKLMGEICGPEGMKMMDNGTGSFMLLPGRPSGNSAENRCRNGQQLTG